MASGKKLVLRRRPMTGLASSAVTVSRRAFLGLASLGTSILSLAGARTAAAQRKTTPAAAIDVHAHFFPEKFLKSLAGAGGGRPCDPGRLPADQRRRARALRPGALPRLRTLPGAQPPGAAPSGHGDRRRAATLVLSEQSPRQPVRYGPRGRESHPRGCARPLSTPQRRSPPRRWGAAVPLGSPPARPDGS